MTTTTTIALDETLLALVERGAKTQTVRRGHKPWVPGTDAVLASTCGQRRHIRIDSVRHCHLGDLDDHDARRDGFADRAELVAVLERFYPGIRDRDDVTVAGFHLTDPAH